MSGQTDRIIRLIIAMILGISFFLMHTTLTYILQPEGFWVIFLIFAFGFIFQGLKYFFTLPNSQDKPPKIGAAGFLIGAELLPMLFFRIAGSMNAFGMKKELLSTEICIMAIITFQIFADILTAVRKTSDKNDKDK